MSITNEQSARQCSKCGAQLSTGWAYCPACGRSATWQPPKKKRGNGQGSVYRSGNGWTAQVTLYSTLDADGKRIQKRRKKCGFSTKKDALAYIEALRGQQGRRAPALLEYYQIFERDDAPKLSKSKQCAYKIARRRLDDIIGLPVDQLTTVLIQKVIDKEATSYYTARDIRDLLSLLMQKAMADQFVSVNLARHVALPALEERDPTPYTPEEVKALWAAYAAGDAMAGYPLLMIYSGMMPGELLACRADAVDLDACEIRGAGKKTATRKASAIVFPEFLRPVVEDLVARADGEKLLPIGRDRFYADFKDMEKRLGIRQLPPYSCRHTTGTEAARTGVSAPILQQIMRHAKITTTQKYIHLDAKDAHKGINTLSSYSSPVAPSVPANH